MNYRSLFEGIEKAVKLTDGTEVVPINFDNAATTPPFKSVNQSIIKSIPMYSSIGRGAGQKGDWCSEKYEQVRDQILNFFHLQGSQDYTAIYVKNTTEGMNLLAKVCIQSKRDKVLLTRMEHHANDLPWRECASVEYVEVDELGRLNLRQFEEKLRRGMGTIEYVSVTAASNVTGYINPIHEIARVAHYYGAKIIVDAAQLVAHQRINMLGKNVEERIDFLVFSGHKMYAPYGVGIVVGLKEILDRGKPLLTGGGIVESVLDESVIWGQSPKLYEAGTQNFLGIIALETAIQTLEQIGFDQITLHEQELKNYLIRGLRNLPGVQLYGDSGETKDRIGVITFNIQGIHHAKLAQKLAYEFGIATRHGKFCAHPYVNRLLQSNQEKYHINENRSKGESIGMIRVSIGLYNTLEEVKYFLEVIKYITSGRY